MHSFSHFENDQYLDYIMFLVFVSLKQAQLQMEQFFLINE